MHSKFLKLFAIGFLISTLAGCGDPTLDFSSHETLEQSMEEMQAQMKEAGRLGEFKEAFKGVAFNVTMKHQIARGKEDKSNIGTEVDPEKLRAALDDAIGHMSGGEIIAYSEQVIPENSELMKEMLGAAFRANGR